MDPLVHIGAAERLGKELRKTAEGTEHRPENLTAAKKLRSGYCRRDARCKMLVTGGTGAQQLTGGSEAGGGRRAGSRSRSVLVSAWKRKRRMCCYLLFPPSIRNAVL